MCCQCKEKKDDLKCGCEMDVNDIRDIANDVERRLRLRESLEYSDVFIVVCNALINSRFYNKMKREKQGEK